MDVRTEAEAQGGHRSKTMTQGNPGALQGGWRAPVGKVTAKLLSGHRVEFVAPRARVANSPPKNIISPPAPPCWLRSAAFQSPHIVDFLGRRLEFRPCPSVRGVIECRRDRPGAGKCRRRLGREVVMLEALQDFLAVATGRWKEPESLSRSSGWTSGLGAKVTSEGDGRCRRTSLSRCEGRAECSRRSTRSRQRRRPYPKDWWVPRPEWSWMSAASSRWDHQCRPVRKGSGPWRIVRESMLAHKGDEEGVMVADSHRRNLCRVKYKTGSVRRLPRRPRLLGGPHRERWKAQGRRTKWGLTLLASGAHAL